MGRRTGWRRRLGTDIVLASALVSSLQALSHNDTRQPVVRFIDFYLASEQADAPPMSLWERVIYGLAVAKTPARGAHR
jgi:hypothetical protein